MQNTIDLKIKELKEHIKKAFFWDDKRLEEFWSMKNPLLDDRSPQEMCLNEYDFKRLYTLVKFSTVHPKSKWF